MPLYVKSELRAGARVRLTKDASEILLRESRSFSEVKQYDIFLSHNMLDAIEVLALKTDIEGMGWSVYVDWIEDPQLNRSSVTPATANLLRKRMTNCRSRYLGSKPDPSR